MLFTQIKCTSYDLKISKTNFYLIVLQEQAAGWSLQLCKRRKYYPKVAHHGGPLFGWFSYPAIYSFLYIFSLF